VRITVTTVQGDVTPNMKEYAEKKLSKIKKFFAAGMLDARIQLSIEHPWCNAEAIVSVKNSGSMVAKAKSDDMYKAVDAMLDKLERQVKDLKEKISGNRKRASHRSHAVRMDEAIDNAFSEKSE